MSPSIRERERERERERGRQTDRASERESIVWQRFMKRLCRILDIYDCLNILCSLNKVIIIITIIIITRSIIIIKDHGGTLNTILLDHGYTIDQRADGLS